MNNDGKFKRHGTMTGRLDTSKPNLSQVDPYELQVPNSGDPIDPEYLHRAERIVSLIMQQTFEEIGGEPKSRQIEAVRRVLVNQQAQVLLLTDLVRTLAAKERT